MLKIMRFEANQWKHYEDGVLPSEYNGKMIRAIENKEIMLAMLNTCKAEYTNAELEPLSMQVAALDIL